MNKELLNDLYTVFKKHGVDRSYITFQNQAVQEEKIKKIIENPASYDPKTYGSPKIYAEFLERKKDQKFVWLMISTAIKKWRIDRKEAITRYDNGKLIVPDRDPTSNCLLNYGFNRNRVTSLSEFLPSIGHKTSRDLTKIRKLSIEDNDLDNIEIESLATNIYKGKGSRLNRFQLFVKDILDEVKEIDH